MITKWDKYIIVFVVFTALLTYAVFGAFVWSDAPEYAVVCVDGKEYARYKLSEIKDKRVVEIKTAFGTNTLELTSNGVRVTEASCRDQYDVRSGEISKPNQMIICAPNRLSVRITDGENVVDRVTY